MGYHTGVYLEIHDSVSKENSSGFASRGFFSWFLVAVFYALQYIFRVMPNTFSESIMERFGVGAFALGQFSALYYVGYTAAHIPLGILIDRWGPKRVIPLCIALTVLGTVPLIFTSWNLVQVGRVITGIGSAAAALSIFKVSNMYYGKRYAIMSSIAMVIGFSGAMYGGMPIFSLSEAIGWNGVFLTIMAVGAVLAIMSAVLLFDTEDVSADTGRIRDQIKSVICNKKLIAISLLGGCMIGPLEGFADGWATAVLAEVCGVDARSATILPSTIFVGSCIGSLALSYMLSKSYNGLDMIICCGLFTILAFISVLTGSCGTVISAFCSLMVIGFCSAYQLVTVCKAIEYVGKGAVALAAAVSNMIIMVFGYFFHTCISAVINMRWSGEIINGHAVYGADLLTKAMLVVPIGVLIGTVGFLFLRYKEGKV